MKNKSLLIMVCILGNILGLAVFINFLWEMDFTYKNYIERWFAKKNTIKELSLEYMGTAQVDLNQSERFASEIKYHPKYTMAWQIASYSEYNFFNEEMGFDNLTVKNSCRFYWGDWYIVSYGRQITGATYNLSVYNGFWGMPYASSEFPSGGYFVHFEYDETAYYENTVFIYKCDKVQMGNSMYLN